jgi:hypothetical protein
MRWEPAESGVDGSHKIPDTWLHKHYYEALTVLFRIENSLRAFVFIVLKNSKGPEWASLNLKTEDGADTTISAVAKRRLAQDKTFGYLGYTISSPLMHLTSGELIRIILNESYWPLFAPYFPASKSIVQTKLEEIGNVRNAMAHFRPVTPDDVQVVKQNANQVLSGVERLLARIVDCEDNVPTNSSDAWYGELRALAAPNVQLTFNQSDDEAWVRLGIVYACPTLAASAAAQNYRNYRILSLNTSRILRSAPSLLARVVFASEEIPHVLMPDKGTPEFRKGIRFLLSRESLNGGLAEVKKSLEDLMKRIAVETDLIKEDGLARGECVHTVYASAQREAVDKPWAVDTTALQTISREDDPSEFWASHPYFGINFVSHTNRFPWMPVAVSNFSLPW